MQHIVSRKLRRHRSDRRRIDHHALADLHKALGIEPLGQLVELLAHLQGALAQVGVDPVVLRLKIVDFLHPVDVFPILRVEKQLGHAAEPV